MLPLSEQNFIGLLYNKFAFSFSFSYICGYKPKLYPYGTANTRTD
jgi:hypothetical protein